MWNKMGAEHLGGCWLVMELDSVRLVLAAGMIEYLDIETGELLYKENLS